MSQILIWSALFLLMCWGFCPASFFFTFSHSFFPGYLLLFSSVLSAANVWQKRQIMGVMANFTSNFAAMIEHWFFQ